MHQLVHQKPFCPFLPFRKRQTGTALIFAWAAFTWACCSFITSVSAQTLPQVVEHALQAYPSIQSANAKVQAARADIDKARSAHQPQVGMTIASNRYGSGVTPSSVGASSLSPTARVNLWSGGKIEAEASRAEALTRAAEFQRNGTLSLSAALERVSDDLPSLAQYQAQVQAAEAAIKMAKGQYWPTLDASMNRQYNSSTLRFETFTQLQLNAPLYTGGATSALIEGAQGQLRAAQFSLDEARLIAKEKAALAWQEWASSRSRAIAGTSQSDGFPLSASCVLSRNSGQFDQTDLAPGIRIPYNRRFRPALTYMDTLHLASEIKEGRRKSPTNFLKYLREI
jgi:outer membrane protein TolC